MAQESQTRLSLSAPWMMFGVDRFESFFGDVRVDLGRHESRVPEQFLHRAQVGAAVQEVRGKRMAQSVRRQRRL